MVDNRDDSSYADAIEAIRTPEVCKFIIEGYLTIWQLLNFSKPAIEAIRTPEMRKFIIDGHLTMEQLLTLNRYYPHKYNIEAICTPEVRKFIIDGYLTVEQLLNFEKHRYLGKYAIEAIRTPGVRKFIIEGHLTIDQLFNLREYAIEAIRTHGVRTLITSGRMTVAQLARINNYRLLEAITDRDTIQRVTNGILTIEVIIGGRGLHINDRQINDRQSTHAASVHKSVSESALKLMQRYNSIINESLDDIIEELKSFVQSLLPRHIMDNGNDCIIPAQQAIARIIADDYTFMDSVSNISTRQLLALAYLAIKDDSLRIGTKEDAQSSFVKGLMQIQREYNFDQGGTLDDGRVAIPACASGTFNKLINSLQGVHPDCNIVFITKETMSARFPILAREEFKKHYDMCRNAIKLPISLPYVGRLDIDSRIIDKSHEYNVEFIWDLIKPSAKRTMLQEFAPYYTDANNTVDKNKEKDVNDIVEAGKYLFFTPQDLKNLPDCKEDTMPLPRELKRKLSCSW